MVVVEVTEYLADAARGCGAGFPFFTISDSRGVIHVADVLRVLCLILGLMFAGATYRLLRSKKTPGIAARGFKARVLAVTLAAIYVCGTEYQRLGDVVTWRLPLGFAFLAVGVYSFWVPVPKKTDDADPEARLRDLP